MSSAAGSGFQVVVLGQRALSPTVVGLRLGPERPGSAPLRWSAGQYFELFTEQEPERRIPYSIASHLQSERPGEFELAVSMEGSQELLSQVASGAALYVSPARGQFIWQESSGATLLVGIGTGLAPLRAMQQAALAHDPNHRITLLFGARTETDLLWHEEFQRLTLQYPHFVFEPTLTHPSSTWSGRRGRVQEHLANLIQPLLPDVSLYLCGRPSMVDDCTMRAVDLAVPRTRIFSEAY